MPDLPLGSCDSGWMRTDAAKIAHFFNRDGYSACHLWTATALDKPAAPGSPRCPTCVEAVKHGLA